MSRTPHGVRGLKFKDEGTLWLNLGGRTPHGVRGLKCKTPDDCIVYFLSHPAWGAWIEI